MKNKFGLKIKLLTLSVVFSTLIVLVGSSNFFSNQKVHGKYDRIVSQDIPKLGLVSEMYSTYRQVRISLGTMGLAGISKSDADKALAEAFETVKKYDEISASLVQLGIEGKEKELYLNTQNAWEDFKKVGDRISEHYKKGTPEDQKSMIEIFLKDCPEKAKVFGEAIYALNSHYGKAIEAETREAELQAGSNVVFSWALIIFSLVVAQGLGFWLSSSTVTELNSIVTDLSGNANEVSATVSNLRSSSEALSASANEQSGAIQKTAASVEEIRSMVQRNSESSTESAKVSAHSREEANHGQEAVNDMIQAMKDINQSNYRIQEEVESGNRRISEIVQIIQEIENKTKVINEIVFQTKLLSFNASVESARAGEHGKGFAVVADEVGNLANMSGKAAQEISTILAKSVQKVNEIVNETSDRVGKMMNESKDKVEHGSHIAETCGAVLSKIVTNADELSRMVDSISTASKEQSLGVNEIANAIQQLDSATRVNSDETSHTASSALGLSEQVQSLNQSNHRLQILIRGGKAEKRPVVNAFVWRDVYITGVDRMDDEHKTLISKINALVHGVNVGVKKSELKRLFLDLGSYTQKHFTDEEEYMASIDFPELESHALIHKKLLTQVGEYAKKLNSGQLDPVTLVAFLNDWLIKHILGSDMKYARHSQGHVQKPAA